MLNNEQLDLIADVIRPLYQSLEQDVIYDIARRIKKTLTYTRTAELMVMEMEKLGYSPAKIRSEAMKVLRADKEFQKVVEENTLEYKKEVKKLIQKIEKEAERAGNTIVAEAGDMAWIDDMRVWESAGKKLTDDSHLAMLQSAFAEQTAMELKNLTRSTGFKAVSGFESLENAYRRELDKAVLKICTGTFSQEKVLRDVIKELSQSGIRTVDYSSGRTMQIDTAAKLALRTGCHQVSVKIHDQNILNTGENLVYVTEHWGARNEGTGIENHEEWQGKVYFIKPGTDYSKEAKRIKQDRIMDIWYSTGYSPDGSHVSNPLGLHGYNCRHLHMVWFEGSSSLPEKNHRPEPKIINGKKYDYYHMTQKCRSMERGIRALKKEMIARERLGLPTDEIKARISEKTREYRVFCDSCNIPSNTTNLKVDAGAVDIVKTKAYKKAFEVSTNTGKGVYYDEKKDYKIQLQGYSREVNESLSEASKKLAMLGNRDRNEHGVFVNLETGEIGKYVTDELTDSVFPDYKYLKENPNVSVAFLHNHNKDTELSFPDIGLIVNQKEINVVAAVRNDGIITVVESNGTKDGSYLPYKYLQYRLQVENELRDADGFIDPWKVEMKLRDKAIDEYAKGGIMTFGKEI